MQKMDNNLMIIITQFMLIMYAQQWLLKEGIYTPRLCTDEKIWRKRVK